MEGTRPSTPSHGQRAPDTDNTQGNSWHQNKVLNTEQVHHKACHWFTGHSDGPWCFQAGKGRWDILKRVLGSMKVSCLNQQLLSVIKILGEKASAITELHKKHHLSHHLTASWSCWDPTMWVQSSHTGTKSTKHWAMLKWPSLPKKPGYASQFSK